MKKRTVARKCSPCGGVAPSIRATVFARLSYDRAPTQSSRWWALRLAWMTPSVRREKRHKSTNPAKFDQLRLETPPRAPNSWCTKIASFENPQNLLSESRQFDTVLDAKETPPPPHAPNLLAHHIASFAIPQSLPF